MKESSSFLFNAITWPLFGVCAYVQFDAAFAHGFNVSMLPFIALGSAVWIIFNCIQKNSLIYMQLIALSIQAAYTFVVFYFRKDYGPQVYNSVCGYFGAMSVCLICEGISRWHKKVKTLESAFLE